MALDRITTTGTFLVAGQFDEFTINPVATSVNLLSNSDTYLSNFTTNQNGMSFASGFQDPKGGTSAYRVTMTAGTFQYYIIYNTGFSGELTVSAHFKYVSQRYVEMILDNGGANGIVGNYDLLAGTAATSQNGTGVNLSASMVPAGNGWWRCILTGTPNPGGSTARFSIIAAGSNVSVWYPTTAQSANQFDAWGFQVERNTSASIYQSKSGASRAVSPSVTSLTTAGDFLIEGEFDEITMNPTSAQFPNIISASQNFLNASYWNTQSGTCYPTPNAEIAPDGTRTALKITDSVDGTAQTHDIQYGSVTLTAGRQYTYSLFSKPGTLHGVTMGISQTFFTDNTERRVNFNTSNTSLTSVASAANSLTYVTQVLNNGWVRCAITFTATVSTTAAFGMRPMNGSTGFYIGNGLGNMYVWGAQMERGNQMSTYVATTASGVPWNIPAKRITNTGTVYVKDQFDEVNIQGGTQIGGVQYITPGTYSWTCPAGVTSVSVVCVGAGGTGGAYGGSGGALAYKNNILVTSGTSYTVVVGATNSGNFAPPYSFPAGNSSFGSATPVVANGGVGGYSGSATSFTLIGSGYDGGGRGGTASSDFNGVYGYRGGVGGGAGGYSGNGGSGSATDNTAGASGSGGGGGAGTAGTTSAGGGGVGLYGLTFSGSGGENALAGVGKAGKGGSGGTNGDGINGGYYGGGSGPIGSGSPSNQGKSGAVRIIWPGNIRQFPSGSNLGPINETAV